MNFFKLLSGDAFSVMKLQLRSTAKLSPNKLLLLYNQPLCAPLRLCVSRQIPGWAQRIFSRKDAKVANVETSYYGVSESGDLIGISLDWYGRTVVRP